MCKFCSNQKNTKFKLFDIKPIPFFIPTKTFAYSSELQESPDTSTEPIRPQESASASAKPIRSQESPDTSVKPIRPQESTDASVKQIRPQESPDTSVKPIRPQESTDASVKQIRPQESTGASAKPLKTPKSSRVLLRLSDIFNNPPTPKKFILSQDNSQLLYSQKEPHYQIDTSNNIEIKTTEIKKLLCDYQLTNLYIILFLEDIHIKGFILHISKDLVTIIGPNIKVESNSTDNLIGSPNRINVKIEMIQGIGDVGASLSS
ncbi:hypothetical protein COK25_30670 [Bacillus cereus]|uniref:hypothetical protein n=1 Tax=Bacillus cereus TaxID=1396 RepID=UPI000BEE6E65|nr:hypothetical protein [Bacillus cereus]WIK99046.1 hypothetical protein QPL86_31090 [Bacillus bombysepticus]PEA92542.1 hypothetical protein CON66_29165 [Bacillus cereus]PED34491.1 hypothetical protein CON24_30115 [Bacillus cereus]PEW59867.1 hypothetical protein CN438_10690 [Bacillus cereus]PEX42486.1 hypothetical protein CN456_24900 [Bacillus cereus]